MIDKILRVFVNTLTVADNHYLLNRGNLTQPIQMQLSRKQKTVSQFSSPFLKFSLNFEHFQKNGDSHSGGVSEITDSKKNCYINV